MIDVGTPRLSYYVDVLTHFGACLEVVSFFISEDNIWKQ